MRPLAQLVRAESRQHGEQVLAPGAVVRQEGFEQLGMGQVQPACACHQELASRRRFGIVDVHSQAVPAQDFGGH